MGGVLKLTGVVWAFAARGGFDNVVTGTEGKRSRCCSVSVNVGPGGVAVDVVDFGDSGVECFLMVVESCFGVSLPC